MRMTILIKEQNLRLLILLIFLILSNSYAKYLYVSTTGSDATSYASNDIDHPWLTVSHAWTTAQAGDTVYYRAGTYTISSAISFETAGTANVYHKAYSGESVTWSSSLTGTTIYVEAQYITVDSIICSGNGGSSEAAFFYIGDTNDADYFTLKYCYVTMQNSGDNGACVHLQASRADHATIQNCTIVGPLNRTNTNSSSIAIGTANTSDVTIINNDISDGYYGIYYKRANPVGDTESEIAYNYIEPVGSSIYGSCYYVNIHNNIFNGGHVILGVDGGDGLGGDYNTFNHNTFYDCRLELRENGTTAEDNNITNNLFVNEVYISPYGTDGGYQDSVDYNLYPTGNAVLYNSNHYTLTNWRSVSSKDAHSIGGAPTFVGGGSPSSISDYALTAESNGYQACADNSDMGADVSLVGSSVEQQSESESASQKKTDVSSVTEDSN